MRTVRETAAAVAAGELDPVEVLEGHLAVADERNRELNAIVVSAAGRAREEAVAGRAGPLAGVPFTVKEAIECEGLEAREGSRLRPLERASHDAPAIARLRSAGAVLVGKTNLSELCAHPDTSNLVYGATRNPHDPSRSAGGSSGGEGAAVASGMSAFGIGSDYGGSVRAPAHFCGVAGMRPGLGRVPTDGHLPHVQPPLRRYWSTIGVLAPFVDDLELVLSVMAGEPIGFAPLPPRVAIYRDLLDRPVGRACADAVLRAADALSCEVDEATPPWQLEAEAVYDEASPAETRRILEELGPLDEASPQLLAIWEAVREAPAVGDGHLPLVREVEARAQPWLDEHPVLLAPAAAEPAFELGYLGLDVFDLFHHCKLASALGLPAAVVPVGRSPEGLPVGVQVIGRRGREDEVLAVCRAIEAGT